MLAQLLANQAASAIANSRLYEATRRYADELEQRVADRTAELTRANEELQAEIIVRHQAEEQLIIARDQALAASRFKTELVAKISHELRTPLSAILGLTELLRMEVFGPVSGEQMEATAKILDSTHYLTSLVNELLHQARLDAGRFSLKRDTFKPADVLARVESKMIVLARTKGLNLVTDIAAVVPKLVSGDLDQVQQILVNLVGNAIKFTNAGTVTVRLYCPDPTHWALQVADTGPGIPAEAQSYIFEPFRQVDGSMTRAHQGTGLGLSIVKQLVDLMGGQITVASEVGRGSAFTVVLPLTL
jgi:signal transduction histidine kinase